MGYIEHYGGRRDCINIITEWHGSRNREVTWSSTLWDYAHTRMIREKNKSHLSEHIFHLIWIGITTRFFSNWTMLTNPWNLDVFPPFHIKGLEVCFSSGLCIFFSDKRKGDQTTFPISLSFYILKSPKSMHSKSRSKLKVNPTNVRNPLQ